MNVEKYIKINIDCCILPKINVERVYKCCKMKETDMKLLILIKN